MVRVIIPFHLQNLANAPREFRLDLPSSNGAATISVVLEAVEEKFPRLRGAIRDHVTLKRRPLLRYFACGEDLSHEPAETTLPAAVLDGTEPFIILGAIAGG